MVYKVVCYTNKDKVLATLRRVLVESVVLQKLFEQDMHHIDYTFVGLCPELTARLVLNLIDYRVNHKLLYVITLNKLVLNLFL